MQCPKGKGLAGINHNAINALLSKGVILGLSEGNIGNVGGQLGLDFGKYLLTFFGIGFAALLTDQLIHGLAVIKGALALGTPFFTTCFWATFGAI